MNCADAREWTAAGSGTIGLTELALVEAHLRRCVECRSFSSPRPTPPPPEPAASLALVETARAGAGALDVMPGLRARVGGLRARLHATFSMPLPPPARLMWLGLLATLAIYAGHSALHRRAESPIDAGGEVMLAAVPAESSSAVPAESPAPVDANLDMESATSSTIDRSTADQSESSSLPEIESGVPSAPVSVERPEPEVRRVAASPPVSVTVQKPEPARTQPPVTKRVGTASPEPAPRRVPPLAHVAGQLSVKNRSVAERDLTDLLAQTGGTVVGTDQDGDIVFVDAVLPQSGYEEFTRGLTRIGSWRVEAERSPLPENVHVTIRVGG
jgi:hypothetical protein